MTRVSHMRSTHAAALLLALAGTDGCNMGSDDVTEATATLRLTTVIRQSDGLEIYDGCVVNRVGAPIPAFQSAPGDILTEHVSIVERTKRTEAYTPAISDYTDDSYWCGTDDSYGQDRTGAVGRLDCYQAAGSDPPAIVLSATLEYGSSTTLPAAVSRTIQVRHSGTLTLEPDPPCPGPGLVPPTVEELTILE
jgi:hypothetical protein